MKEHVQKLYKMLNEKDKEIERLNNDIKELLKENSNKEKVILKQDNIINEIEKEVAMLLIGSVSDKDKKPYNLLYHLGVKIKELKGSDKE